MGVASALSGPTIVDVGDPERPSAGDSARLRFPGSTVQAGSRPKRSPSKPRGHSYEACELALEELIQYAFEQHIIPRREPVEELFPASTAYLGDCMSALIARLLARIAVALVTAVLLRAAYLRVEYPGFSRFLINQATRTAAGIRIWYLGKILKMAQETGAEKTS